jgi:hypothetical protein
MTRLAPVASAAVLLAALGAGNATAAPITFNTALPVARGEGIVRVQAVYRRATGDPSPADRDLEVWAFPLVAAWGATPDLALFAVVPFLDKDLEVTTPAGRRSRNVTGLGDASVFARYTLLRRDRRGETVRLAPFLGVKLPTGDDDESDALGRLPPRLQLGSGSWDPFGGVVLTWQTLAWQFDAAIAYRHPTEAGDVQLGDEIRLDASLQYRLWPRDLGRGVPAFLYGVLEANGLWEDEDRIRGRSDPDSGGTSLFLTPGLQHVTRRTVTEAAVQLPLYQARNGDGLEDDYAVVLSFRLNF